jgi:hypothetical protein
MPTWAAGQASPGGADRGLCCRAALERGYLETQVVGDLVEGDARAFLNHRLQVLRSTGGAPVGCDV